MIIKIIDKVDNYEQAIKITCDMLEDANIIKPEYFRAILDKIKEFGPYFCFGNGVCMPHAQTKDGNLSQGMAILKLNNPIDFMGNSINIFFTLAAKDNTSHMGLLQIVSSICGDENLLSSILNSNTEDEIKHIIDNIGE